MNINDFIVYLNQHKDQYRNYMEIVLSPLGQVCLAHPCHTEKLLELAAKKYNISKEEYKQSVPKSCSPIHWVVSKENYISVWFDNIIVPKNGFSRFQKRTIKILQDKGFLSKTLNVETTDEYQRYLKRKELYGE